MPYKKVKVTNEMHNVVDVETGYIVGSVRATHKTASQRFWSGEFSVPLADGTVANIVVTGELGNTAAKVIRTFEAEVATKDVVLPTLGAAALEHELAV